MSQHVTSFEDLETTYGTLPWYDPTTNDTNPSDTQPCSYQLDVLHHLDNETLFEHYPPALLDFGAVTCIVFAIIGVMGNTITILALSKCPRLRNATTTFIINLCVADLVFCCFSLPLSAVTFLERGWNYGDSLCKLFPLFRYSNGAVSIFSVIAITLNRYVLVVHQKVYSTIYKPRNITTMIVGMWVFSFLLLTPTLFEIWGKFGYDPKVGTCSILPLKGKSPKVFLYTSSFGISFLIFIFCYSRIFWVVRRASKKAAHKDTNRIPSQVTFTPKARWYRRHYQVQMSTSDSQVHNKRARTELRVLKVMLVVFLSFVLCYFPASFVKVFRKEDDLPVLNILGYLGVYLSNCINPFIYAAMSSEYRRAYGELFCRKLSRTTSLSRSV